MTWPTLEQLIARLLILIIAGPAHELAHAWAAYRLGDRTAYAYGRISLNPLDHIDPIGALMILLTGFGWFKPVPVDPYQLRRAPSARHGMALTAAAGPLSNLLLAIIAAVLWRLGARNLPWDSISQIYVQFIWINIILALFNMIPIPPLDGSKVLMGIAPTEWSNALLSIEPYGMYIFLALILVPGLVSLLIGTPALLLFRLLVGS